MAAYFMTRTPYVEEWFRYADDDLAAARIMIAEGSLPNPICFHAQQAGEKALKGYLAANDCHVRKIHALDELLKECAGIDRTFESLRDDAVYLSKFTTEARYPGDFPAFTMEQAQRAYDSATRVRDFVEERLRAGTTDVAA